MGTEGGGEVDARHLPVARAVASRPERRDDRRRARFLVRLGSPNSGGRIPTSIQPSSRSSKATRSWARRRISPTASPAAATRSTARGAQRRGEPSLSSPRASRRCSRRWLKPVLSTTANTQTISTMSAIATIPTGVIAFPALPVACVPLVSQFGSPQTIVQAKIGPVCGIAGTIRAFGCLGDTTFCWRVGISSTTPPIAARQPGGTTAPPVE